MQQRRRSAKWTTRLHNLLAERMNFFDTRIYILRRTDTYYPNWVRRRGAYGHHPVGRGRRDFAAHGRSPPGEGRLYGHCHGQVERGARPVGFGATHRSGGDRHLHAAGPGQRLGLGAHGALAPARIAGRLCHRLSRGAGGRDNPGAGIPEAGRSRQAHRHDQGAPRRVRVSRFAGRDHASGAARRIRLSRERADFDASRFSFAALVGRVLRRFFGITAARAIKSTRRANASARFLSRSRKRSAAITSTPSLVIRRPASAAIRRLVPPSSDGERHTSKRSCTARDTFLTFCPPGSGPKARVLWRPGASRAFLWGAGWPWRGGRWARASGGCPPPFVAPAGGAPRPPGGGRGPPPCSTASTRPPSACRARSAPMP